MALSITDQAAISGSKPQIHSAERQTGNKNQASLRSTTQKEGINSAQKDPDIKIVKETLDGFLQHTRLKYSINESINRFVVSIIDGDTNKTIKEIPSEDMQKLSEHIQEALGILLDKTV